ncbi:MAG: MOP flippase family protein [Bacteroidia bacterium]|nr:MOP flippase family protein [Bacteroidia bacterium]
MDNLREKTVSSAKWNALNQVIIQVTLTVTSIILGRFFLSPREYGLMGMITVFTGFANILKDFGISAAIIHKKDITEKDLTTAFWTNVFLGALIGGVFAIAAPWLAVFYKEPALQNITYFVAIHFFISTLSIVQNVLLEKSLRFKDIFMYNITAVGAAAIVAIVMAATGWGVWSLVAQQITNISVLNLMLWFNTRWKPLFQYSVESLKGLLKFSIYLFLASSLNYWNRNLDNMLIGKFAGSDALGNYSRAYSLMLLPLTQIVGMLVKVLFPALALIQQDLVRVKSVYLKALAVIALLTFPFSIGLWLIAEDFILILLGPKWTEAIGVFKILAWAGLLQCVISPIGSLLSALGKTKLHFTLGLLSSVLGISAICLGLWLGGVYGVAYGVCAWAASGIFINLYALKKVINLSPVEFIMNLVPVSLISAVMGVAGYFLNEYALQDLNGYLRMGIMILCCVLIYTPLVSVFKIPAFIEIKNMLLPKLLKK